MALIGCRIHITGIVQGVGFRPYVFNLADRLDLNGWVRNTSAGVIIEVDGDPEKLHLFTSALQNETPPLARIDTFSFETVPANGYKTFEILHSEPIAGAFQPISPDISMCPDCLRELLDINNRRYRYPFINCTNCGPRFTIIQDIPYDRPNTTMADYDLCPQCSAEYDDPRDRRFHAQPIACPECGPQIWLETKSNIRDQRKKITGTDEVLMEVHRLLREGKILAIKGLGGFHLACDASNPAAVEALRRRKLRVDKPFAVMVANLDAAERQCHLSPFERQLLDSRERPIIILNRRIDATIVSEVAPSQKTIGLLLPYTPLHTLLFEKCPRELDRGGICDALVMTSGNLSEEPIAIENEEARQRLTGLADAFLMHDRPIHIRCDDSVINTFEAHPMDSTDSSFHPEHQAQFPMMIRRSRGFAPNPITLPWKSKAILATGAELKNTFCLARENYAFMSHHIGDLENYESLVSFEDGIAHYERLFHVQPELIAYDLHPNYLSTRYALERAERERLPSVGVQHHHAHIAACMAENEIQDNQRVIGVAFDGTGYGEDGAIWGGEFLVADYIGFDRVAHLAYTPLPGGDTAIRHPARTALAYLWQAGLEWESHLVPYESLCVEERQSLRTQLEKKINSPLTSSMGRLFDAAAALAGVRQEVNYEAQAAIEFEALVDPQEKAAFPFELIQHANSSLPNLEINPAPLFSALVSDLSKHVSIPAISARFHNSVAAIVRDTSLSIRKSNGISTIILSGGVWQNRTLLQKTLVLLSQAGFQVYVHRHLPPNDGGLALGQAAIAWHRWQRGTIDVTEV